MIANDEERIKRLLQHALPPIGGEAEAGRDLWPAVLRRLEAKPAGSLSAWAWFDISLLAGLVGAAALFPSAIPVFLYYL